MGCVAPGGGGASGIYSQYNVLFYYWMYHCCKRNGIPLSEHFMYLDIVLYWSDDGYGIAETCRRVVN